MHFRKYLPSNSFRMIFVAKVLCVIIQCLFMWININLSKMYWGKIKSFLRDYVVLSARQLSHAFDSIVVIVIIVSRISHKFAFELRTKSGIRNLCFSLCFTASAYIYLLHASLNDGICLQEKGRAVLALNWLLNHSRWMHIFIMTIWSLSIHCFSLNHHTERLLTMYRFPSQVTNFSNSQFLSFTRVFVQWKIYFSSFFCTV